VRKKNQLFDLKKKLVRVETIHILKLLTNNVAININMFSLFVCEM